MFILIQDILEAGFKVNPQKCVLKPTLVKNHLVFDLNLKEGNLQISPQKAKNGKKRKWSWANCYQRQFDMSKDGLNFRPSKKFFGGIPLSKNLYRHYVPICKRFHSKSWNHLQKVPFDLKEQLREITILLDN
jgi:hypothetical protein